MSVEPSENSFRFSEAQEPVFYGKAQRFCSYMGERKPIWTRSLHVEGIENFPPEGPAVIAPTHRAFWDPTYVGIISPRALYSMTKKELWMWTRPHLRPFGFLVGRLGGFPVNRQRPGPSTMKYGAEVLRNGGVVMTFPEGTSKRRGEKIYDLFEGVGQLAVNASFENPCPLIPVGIASENLRRGETV